VVLQVPMIRRDVVAGTITYVDPDTNEEVTTPVTGGNVKCQWKADWAMRWAALGIDYEMAGKDLIDSVTLSSKICRVLGATPPEGFNYELFLDQNGEKISKSKGNGLTIEDWLTYASPESLSLYMFQKPKTAKKLYFEVIPRAVDEYLQLLAAYPRQDGKARLDNAIWHIHSGTPPVHAERGSATTGELPITFALLLNLVAASNAEDKSVLWGFIKRHFPDASPEAYPLLDQLAGYAVRYYADFVKTKKRYRVADEVERAALEALSAALAKAPKGATAEELQSILYDVGRAVPRYQDFEAKGATPEKPGVSNAWFNSIYEILLGESKGPRFGSFIALYGLDETRALIAAALEGDLVRADASGTS
jgi:lysyl-tRNA synthetase class 1